MHPEQKVASSQVKDQAKTRRGDARRQGEYHHGTLREALLSAAEALLLERGVEAFSLRAVSYTHLTLPTSDLV